jgi:Protein of unknown function (DUF2974)
MLIGKMIENLSATKPSSPRNQLFARDLTLPIGLGRLDIGNAKPVSIGQTAASAVSTREAAAYALRQDPVTLAQVPPQAMAATGATLVPTRELALLSADVYRDTSSPPAGYRVASAADLGALGLNPADLTSTQSGFRARVYVTGAGKDAHYVVAFRGSATANDWRSNLQQGFGLTPDNYRKALAIGSKLALADKANITITGHSLGGGLASAAAIASGRNATTFNSAGLSDSNIRQARAIYDAAGARTQENVTAYYVRGEILSTLQDGGDRVIGGILGGLLGASTLDAPEAYGTRIGLKSVRPEGVKWYQDNPAARHGMDWVLQSLNGR